MPASIAIVVPCFNEEEVLSETVARLSDLMERMQESGKISSDSQCYFVDDGSTDETWSVIKKFAQTSQRVGGIKLSRNRGHQNALLAGLHHASGDCVISIDADLQDDIGVIETMVDRFCEGYDVVYGVRADRSSDSAFKRATAEMYYGALSILGVDIVFNHADYRLLSRRALECLKEYEEVNLFLRGIVPTLGFKTCQVEYERAERYAGESKYPLKKMLALALDGVTSFSAVPLRFVAVLGIIGFVASLMVSGWAIWARLTGQVVPGWASSVLPIYLLGGLQLLSLGVVGEYVAKTYMETKHRPRYFIEDSI